MGNQQLTHLVSKVILPVFYCLLPQTLPATDFGNHNKQFTPAHKMSSSDWSNPQELDRVWNASLVRIPKENGRYLRAYMYETAGLDLPDQKFPTVIYLHGCAGTWHGTHTRLDFLARHGFAVIAPQSFARSRYPQSCDLVNLKSGMYRGTLKMRQLDAAHAISRAKNLAWVDPQNMFLMGLSQGGITTATHRPANASTRVKARIIEGWTCHAGWQEYKGLNAAADEPVLALVGKDDPWFRASWSRGDCGAFMNKKNGSKSVVFQDAPLNVRHELLEDDGVQKIVLRFLSGRI